MLLSMTGFGEGQAEGGGETVRVEIRTVNNRHFKLSCRLPDGYASLEGPIEALVRQQVRRGTVQLNLQITREACAEDYQLNEAILMHYHRQLDSVRSRLHDLAELPLAALLGLPGVVTDASRKPVDLETEWPMVARAIQQGLSGLQQMRAQEGQALAADMAANCQVIERQLDQIAERAPQIVRAYEARLLERINQLLADRGVQMEPAAVIREVGLFADRIDFAEETVRLRSHLQQFAAVMTSEASPGRKLEFLVQEMLRETNTIGSKANDAPVARHVVEIKTAIERLREMIQNVE